jgi:FMN phosphatase YigB (HAD superfamily)
MGADNTFNLPRPDIILFDFDNTLYPYDPCNNAAINKVLMVASKRFNLHINIVLEAYEAARKTVKRRVGCVASSHSRLLYFHCMLEELGLGSQVEEALRLEQLYWRMYIIRMQLFPNAIDFIHNLRSYGIKLGLVTDLTAQIQFRKLVALGISSMFDAVVASEETIGEKETGAPYNLMSEKLNFKENDVIWMIGDSEADVISCKTFLNAFTICITAGLKSTPPPADATFSSFSELNTAVDMVLRDAR